MGQINSPAFRVPSASDALLHYSYVLVIGGGITLLFNFLQTPGGEMRATTGPGTTGMVGSVAGSMQEDGGTARLSERLPAELGSDIIALEMEDHYVRVHTALGNELVLMRLRDAIKEVEGIDGMQVHRSWWVARGAVADVLREGRNVRLKLDTDIEAPVSRANVQALKDAGWF